MTFTPTVLTDCLIIVNSQTLSDHANKAEIPFSTEDLDATTFGQTWHVRRGGLNDASLNLTWLNDFSASNLDSQIFALLGTVVTFEIRPTSSARATTNPGYTGSVLINSWKPISADVGKLVTVDVSWPTSGAVSRQTS